METTREIRKGNALAWALQLIVLSLITCVTTSYGQNFNITLLSLTNHNTSAFSNYNSSFQNFTPATSHIDTSLDTIPTVNEDRSLNPATPGHVSKTDVHTLIPKRPDLRWFAHVVPWFGNGHTDIGLNSNTTNWVDTAINDMINRGFNGIIIDWYGTNRFEDSVTLKIQSYIDTLPANKFTMIIMIDKGIGGGLTTNNLVNQINYVKRQYFSDSHYERETNGQPFLLFFGVADVITNTYGPNGMDTLKAECGGNMMWVEQRTKYIGSAWENGVFNWADPYDQPTPPPASNPFNTNVIINDFGTIASHPTKMAFGAMSGSFNGTLTSNINWSDGKYLPSSNGLCLFQRAQIINANIPNNMTRMQWVTWDDWQEGSAAEPGIENNVHLSTSINGAGLLSWTITSGESRAVDHFEIYASKDGLNAALLATVTNSATQTNISQLLFSPGSYSIYVDAIGLPCVRDHMSSPVNYVVNAQTLIPTDYSRSMKITFTGYNRATAVSNFPVLVNFSTNLSGFAYSQFMSPTANDLRFTDSSGNILNHEIDQWNTNGTSTVWVSVPVIASSSDFITAYWGNRADTNTPSFTTNGATWGGDFNVLHLKEGGFPYADSTTLHPATTGVAPAQTTGEIGNGEAFSGTQFLVPSGAINLGNSFSFSAWVNVTNTASNIQCLWANKVGGATANGVALFINKFNTTDGQLLLESGDGTGGGLTVSISNIVTAGAWHNVSASVNRSAGTANLYVDGADVTVSGGTLNTSFANNNVFNLGRYTDGSFPYHGIVDEARIEPFRTADWVWASWMTVASNSVLANYGPATLTKVLDQDAFTSAMKVTTSGYTRGTTLTNFPLLVQLSTAISGFSYSQFASSVGNDLRFTDASGQILCNYQIDTWNTNGVSSVWVQVPAISSSTNYILAYWGNPALTNAAPFTTNGATWSNYFGVFHLKETGFPYADSTTLHPATAGTAPTPTTGEIGNAENFNGTTQYLAPNGAINLGNSFSLSAWVNITNTASNIQCVWANKVGGGNSNGIALFINKFNTTDGQLLVETGDGVTAGGLTQSISNVVTAGAWHHVFASVNRSGSTINLYVDGTDVTASGGTVNANFGNNLAFNLGRYLDGSWHFHGNMDEARIEPLRSADWVWATWMNVASNSTFLSYPAVFVPAAIVHQVQPPQLQMSLGANGLLFNWANQGANFALYSTTNLTSPVQWGLVTNATVLPDGTVQVPAPATSGAAVFYRLQSQ